jgi:hypothetical protein
VDAGRRNRWLWVTTGIVSATVLAVVLLDFFGIQLLPMTADRANQLYGSKFKPGVLQYEVEEQLRAEGQGFQTMQRRKQGLSMDRRGSQSVAECAGLKNDSVRSILRAVHVNNGWLGYSEVVVYLFFDIEGRLIRHWVDEFHRSL